MFLLANIFQPLIDVFEAVLKFFHNSLGVPWGWAIVLLTVVVRAVLVPLTFKQLHSMQKLQRLQPEMKAIQQKYKDDKQRQQQEIMKFYRENQVNPFASCLPLAAQLPVFISLFYMLRSSLRHDICPDKNPLHVAHTVPCGPHGGAGFLFINDLTNKGTGVVLVVLLLLYVGTQLASTLMMSAPTMEKTQRQLMVLMPLFFVVFIISFPTGVIVYWITTNAWTILQQFVIRRRLGPMTPPVAAPVAGGGGPGGGGGGGPGGGFARGRGGPGTSPGGGADGADGTGGGGLGALLRSRLKPSEDKETAGVSTGTRERRTGPPPRPPRKKKKRSGRRR
jgi:YidC/Oxa1 family membrane protein insertase